MFVTVRSVVAMVTVGVMFMLTITVVVRAFTIVVLARVSILVQFILGMKHDVVWGITQREDVDLPRRGQCNISLDEWHAECMAESIGQADSFLAQRGSAKVVGETIVVSLESGLHEDYGTDDAGDVVIIAVYIGVCQRVAKANVRIRIGCILDDADRLRCNEADWGHKQLLSRYRWIEVAEVCLTYARSR